jgi:hypothetical protein
MDKKIGLTYADSRPLSERKVAKLWSLLLFHFTEAFRIEPFWVRVVLWVVM